MKKILFSLILISNLATSQTLLTNLVAYYRMQSSGNDTTGTYNPTATAGTSFSNSYGKILEGCQFNGTSTKLTYPHLTALDGSAHFSCSYWKYINSWADGTQQMDLNVYQGGCSQFFIRSGYPLKGDVGCEITNGSNEPQWKAAGALTALNTWYHIVVTWDGTISTGSARAIIYVNGVKQTTTLVNGTPSTVMNTCTTAFRMGNDGFSDGYTNANLDEIGIWSRTLSQADVNELYNAGSGLTYPFLAQNGNFLMFFNK